MLELLLTTMLAVLAVDRAEADAAFTAGEWARARTLYEAVLPEATDASVRADILDRIGVTVMREGGVWDAETWFTRSLEATETASARVHRAQVYVRAGQRAARDPSAIGAEIVSLMNDAVRELRRALELDDASAEAWYTLGMAEWYRRDEAAAEKSFRKALEVSPGRADVSLDLSWLLEGRGEAAKAREALSAVPEDRRGAAHWSALGRLELAAGEEAAGVEALTRAVLAAPEEVFTYDALWQATARKKRFAAFGKAMDRVLEARPGAWLAHFFMGFCHRYAGRPKEAIASFEKTLEIRPEEVQARVKIADILSEDLLDPDAAAPVYLEALKADPENARARYEVSRLALNKAAEGDFESAKRLFTALKEAQPNEASHYANLALVMKELGEPERGLELYTLAEERFPFNAQIPNDRGLMLMSLGREEEAFDAFRAALDRDPEFLDSLENLGAYTRLAGRPRDSIAFFRTAYNRVRREGGDASKFRRYLDEVAREVR